MINITINHIGKKVQISPSFIQRQRTSTINEKTVPIGGLEGFDSLNGLELSMMLPKEINWSGKNVCVSDDGKKALSIGEIVDRLLNFQNPSE